MVAIAMKKLLWIFLFTAGLGLPYSASTASSLLPDYEQDEYVCDPADPAFEEFLEVISAEDYFREILNDIGVDKGEEILGCAIRSGYMKFWMLPFFILFALEFLIELSGAFAVLMVMVGAYYYIAGGLTDDKEKGKTIITYALGGFVLVLASWALVNLLLLALTT